MASDVSQRAREAAAKLCGFDTPEDVPYWGSGKQQSVYAEAVQAFARFEAEIRDDTTAIERERCALVADRISGECADDEHNCSLDDEFGAAAAFGGKIEARKVAAAIRKGPTP